MNYLRKDLPRPIDDGNYFINPHGAKRVMYENFALIYGKKCSKRNQKRKIR